MTTLELFLVDAHSTYGPHRSAWPQEVRDCEFVLARLAEEEERRNGGQRNAAAIERLRTSGVLGADGQWKR